jgi:hypothetical protein
VNDITAESALRILDAHTGLGDLGLRIATKHLITLDELVLTPMQRKAREEQLAAMRAGQLRRLPTVFGELQEA